MEKQATVRGEFHISTIDRKAILDRDLSDIQALYLEGRSEIIKLHTATNSYYLYLLGYFFLELIYGSAYYLHERLLPTEGYDIEKEAHERGLDVESETDLEIDEIYDSISPRIIHSSLLIVVLGFLLTLWRAFHEETIDLLVVSTAIPYWTLPLTMGICLPLLFSGLLIVFGDEGDRDERMAASINAIAEGNEHDSVLVLVGDTHVDPVSEGLEAQGWQVTRERSAHPIPRLARLL